MTKQFNDLTEFIQNDGTAKEYLQMRRSKEFTLDETVQAELQTSTTDTFEYSEQEIPTIPHFDTTPKPLTLTGHLIEDIYKDNTPAPVSIIEPGILPKQGICLIGAPPKAMKSMFVQNLSICLASGKDFYDFKIKQPFRTYYLQAELSYYNNRDTRIKPMLSNNINCNHNLFISDRITFDVLNNYQALADEMTRFETDVLIIDPLVSFHVAEENSNNEMQRVMESFRKLTTDCNLSIILIHHSNKGQNKGGDNIRGASSIFGAIDTLIEIKKEETSHINMNFKQRYGAPLDQIRFKLNPKTCWLEKCDISNLSPNQDDFIINYVKGNEGLKMIKLIKSITEKFNKHENTARNWIKKLIENRELRSEGDQNPKIFSIGKR